ncbi:hypothetical protein EDB85DRAFT_2150720 [Lactarius pseudohatsudake]|nr:hypothetical protein EDB85DRAFT_2150720 [Lactarius pseudohatsudake]
MNRMLLQASCLVRLGNMLLANSQTSFFVKAIYIDGEYEAIEYTLFQRGTKPYGNVVEYSKGFAPTTLVADFCSVLYQESD